MSSIKSLIVQKFTKVSLDAGGHEIATTKLATAPKYWQLSGVHAWQKDHRSFVLTHQFSFLVLVQDGDDRQEKWGFELPAINVSLLSSLVVTQQPHTVSTPWPLEVLPETLVLGDYLHSPAHYWAALLSETDSSPLCTGSKAVHPPCNAILVRTLY